MDEAFNQILRRLFKISEIRDDMTGKEVPEWDSMNYLLLIAELENRFSLVFTMNEVVEARSVGDLRKVVRTRGVL